MEISPHEITGLRIEAAVNVSGYCPITMFKLGQPRRGVKDVARMLTVGCEEATVAPTVYKLLAVPAFRYTLSNEVVDRTNAILDIQCAALSEQLSDICFAESERACIVDQRAGV